MIRFQRIGRRNDAAFRIVVTEKSRGPKAGKYVELLGSYNPKTKAFSIKEDSLKIRMAHGAQVSPSLNNLLINKGILMGKKINVLPRKQPIKKEGQDGDKSEQDVTATPKGAAAPEETPATDENSSSDSEAPAAEKEAVTEEAAPAAA